MECKATLSMSQVGCMELMRCIEDGGTSLSRKFRVSRSGCMADLCRTSGLLPITSMNRIIGREPDDPRESVGASS